MVCIFGNLCRGKLTQSVSIGTNPDNRSARQPQQNDLINNDDVEYNPTLEDLRQMAREFVAQQQQDPEVREREAFRSATLARVPDFSEWQMARWRKIAQEILAEQAEQQERFACAVQQSAANFEK